MSTCLVAAGGTLSRVIEPNLGNSGSSMMALWQGWLRRATPPVIATAAVGELLLGLFLKLNLISSVGHFARDCPTFTGVRRDAMVIFCVCNLMHNIIESLNSQVAADPFVELDSLEEITRALLSATDATSWSPASPSLKCTFCVQNGTLCQRMP